MGLRWVLSLLCACVWLWAANAHADEAADKSEAERLFKAGVSLQRAEDFDAAIAAFESSLRLYPTKSALFNLANCLQAIHRYPEALSALERLETEHGHELEEAMRGRVEIQRAELENLTATLSLEVSPAGAEVSVDGRPLGRAPLSSPIRLALGDHEIEVVLEGYVSERRSVNLSPRQQVSQSFELQKAPPRAEVAPAPAPLAEPPPRAPAPVPVDRGATPEDESSTGSFAAWTLVGTGGVLLGAGTVTGIWALSLDGRLSDTCYETHCHTSKKGDVDGLNRLTTATNVLLGVGAASAAAGLLMLWLDEDEAQAATRRASVAVTVAPGYVGAGVGGGF